MNRGARIAIAGLLGAGLGGLDWAVVRSRIEHALGNLQDVQVILFEPGRAPAVKHGTRAGQVPTLNRAPFRRVAGSGCPDSCTCDCSSVWTAPARSCPRR